MNKCETWCLKLEGSFATKNTIFLYVYYILGELGKENETNEAWGTYEKDQNAHKILLGDNKTDKWIQSRYVSSTNCITCYRHIHNAITSGLS